MCGVVPCKCAEGRGGLWGGSTQCLLGEGQPEVLARWLGPRGLSGWTCV